ncbi:hypothetical protein QVD17_06774 [Tagetes erecta]|uniref:Uncharacterized protein n=1 Tax=Tagetes erecta TaxID=13708 RepID=A0AAD8LEU5_TARER|nr:hypothetical protein QVD17_06774 [Tagetes erecta]
MNATLQTEVSPIDIQFKEDEAEEDHQDVGIFTFNKIIYPNPVVDSLPLFLTSASKRTTPMGEMHVYAKGLFLATDAAIYKDIATEVDMELRLFSLKNVNRTLAIFRKHNHVEVEEKKGL